MLCGVAVDKMKVLVNGDFHEFEFDGQASDLLDSSSFESGQGALTTFPPEPTIANINYSIIPGHLGQVWMGSVPNRFFTLTKAELLVENGIELRAREFGSNLPRCIAPGVRSVTLDFNLYQHDDADTRALYQAARQRSPIGVMMQLGQQTGQMFGLYMTSVIPEVPEFDDTEKRQQWQFQNWRAKGSISDEVFIAFG